MSVPSARALLVAAIVPLLVILTGSGPTRAADPTIRIALQPAPLLAFYVKEKQLLEKRGFKPEWSVLPYAAPQLEALASGSIDMAVMGTLPIVMVALKDPGIWYVYDELGNGSGMVVGNDTSIRSAADLKGKKIAFPGKGSQQFGLLMSYLGAAGLKEGDVDLIRANVPDMTTLLQKKEVDGFLGWAPFTSEAVRTGAARKLWTSDDLVKLKAGHWLNAGWAVRADFAKANEPAVLALIESLHEATAALRDHPDEVIAVFSRATGLSQEASLYTVKENYFVYFDPKDTVPAVGPLKSMFELLAKNGIVKDDPRIDTVLGSLVHPEYAQKALAAKK